MTDRTMFDASFASRANYWLGLAADVAGSVALVAIGCAASSTALSALAAILAGALAFTLYEYALHRWLYHGAANPVAILHARHHRDPAALVGAPFYFSLGFTALHWAAAARLAGPAVACAFAGMILFGYAQQSVIHHVAHNWPRTGGRGARLMLRRHHLLHHRTGAGNFGISTRLWDHVFGTVVRR